MYLKLYILLTILGHVCHPKTSFLVLRQEPIRRKNAALSLPPTSSAADIKEIEAPEGESGQAGALLEAMEVDDHAEGMEVDPVLGEHGGEAVEVAPVLKENDAEAVQIAPNGGEPVEAVLKEDGGEVPEQSEKGTKDERPLLLRSEQQRMLSESLQEAGKQRGRGRGRGRGMKTGRGAGTEEPEDPLTDEMEDGEEVLAKKPAGKFKKPSPVDYPVKPTCKAKKQGARADVGFEGSCLAPAKGCPEHVG